VTRSVARRVYHARMADEGLRLGIDFGTSNTVGCLRRGDGPVEPLLFDASALLASAVFAGADGEVLTGADAARAAGAHPAGLEPNPKQRIDDDTVWLGEREFAVADLFAAVLRRVRQEAERVGGEPPSETVLTYPAGWSGARTAVLAEAARRAGLGEVWLIREPVAAAAYFASVLGRHLPAGQCLIVYDFGAGTFDVTVVRPTDDGITLVAADGLPDVGGNDLDAVIVELLRASTPAAAAVWGRLEWPQTAADRRARRTLWLEARAAKEQLTRHASADVHIPIAELDVHVTREEFERAARGLLDRTVALTVATLRAAGVRRDTVGGVLLVGGSSRIPLAASLLHRVLDIPPTVIEQPELVVAYGSLHAPAALLTRPPAPAATPAPPPRFVSPAPVPYAPVSVAPVAPGPVSPAPVAPAAVSAAPVSPAPISLAPLSSAPVSPAPVSPAPVAPAAVSAAPVSPAPISLAPLSSAPVSPAPIAAAPEPPAPEPPTPNGPEAPKPRRRRLRMVVAVAVSVVVAAAASVWVFETLGPDRIAADVTLDQPDGNFFSGLTFSPDGKLLATATESGSGYLWNLETREHYAKLDDGGQSEISFSPDGKTVATAAGGMIGGPSQVWRADNGTRVATLGDNTSGAASIAYSHDSKLIATGGGGGVSLWDPTTGQRKRQLTGSGYFAAFSPDDKLLAVGSGYSGSAIYEVDTGKPTIPLDGHINAVAFSPDGQTLAVTGTDKEPAIRLLDANTGKTITRITDGCDSCLLVAFTPDGRYVVVYDGELRLWSVSSHRTVAVLTGVGSVIYGLAVSPDGTMIGATDGIQLHIWHGHW